MSVGASRIIQARPIQPPLASNQANPAPPTGLPQQKLDADSSPAKSRSPHFIQNGFLEAARKSQDLLQFDLVNRRPISGRVAGYDQFTILLMQEDGRKVLLCKHGIVCVEQACQ